MITNKDWAPRTHESVQQSKAEARTQCRSAPNASLSHETPEGNGTVRKRPQIRQQMPQITMQFPKRRHQLVSYPDADRAFVPHLLILPGGGNPDVGIN